MSAPHTPTPALPIDAAVARQRIDSIVNTVGKVVLGKNEVIQMALACLLARGHLLLEDLPGVGKTTLSQAFARAMGLQFKRVQFTSDLLPADILGASIFDRQTTQFSFKPGPVFTQVLMADELNRTTPKTQSALLEAMEEGQVTVDGHAHALPEPFFVVATQNPTTQMGTFPLPESQLDRFLMRMSIGIPARDAERQMLQGDDRREAMRSIAPAVSGLEWLELQSCAQRVHVSSALLDYVQDLLAASRVSGAGLSPRGGLALLGAARAWALTQGRGMVIPEDVQSVALPVMGHRLERANDRRSGAEIVTELLRSVPV